MNNRYANHPNDSKKYDTNQLREHYMVEEIFVDDKLVWSVKDYSRTSGKVDFSIDVTNASTIRINVTERDYPDPSYGRMLLCLVESELTKK